MLIFKCRHADIKDWDVKKETVFTGKKGDGSLYWKKQGSASFILYSNCIVNYTSNSYIFLFVQLTFQFMKVCFEVVISFTYSKYLLEVLINAYYYYYYKYLLKVLINTYCTFSLVMLLVCFLVNEIIL